MDNMDDFNVLLKTLTMLQIQSCLPSHTFSKAEKRSRAKLDEAATHLPEHLRQVVMETAQNNKRHQTVNSATPLDVPSMNSSVQDETCFMETVSEACQNDCISHFIDATGRDATATSACAVCAGHFFTTDIQQIRVDDLVEKHLLEPSLPHDAHVLTHGILLYQSPRSLFTDDSGNSTANVCSSCIGDLRRGKTPSLSLANKMWIGDVPPELRILTLPEKILIARYFPTAYIVKLYPKKKGARSWSTSGMHSGLRGNVSTYRLNTDDIVHMTDTQVMPPLPAILAATVGVTFVGPKNVPEKTMPGFLRVNRNRVRTALQWLKDNNPLYRDIIISTDRLNNLPEDAVPTEIMSLAKHSNDTTLLATESEGYVPDDVLLDEESDGVPCSESEVELDDESYDENLPSEDAQTVPLQSLGVVNVAATEVTENEILAHALENVSREEKQEAWAVKRSSDFVNEYTRWNEEGECFEGTPENPNHLLGSFPCLFPYGHGGFEIDRPRKVSYSAHARWAIRYDDKRFRQDLHFIFQVFGVIQKRELCAAAVLQISKQSFSRHEQEIRNLSQTDFAQAGAEERANKPITNEVLNSLRHSLTAIRAKVVGTDESRIKIRSLIWGMCVKKGPPSIWLTINPADTQDPIAHVLCDQQIDLDAFNALDHVPCSSSIANDPYAAASYFQLIINAVLRHLLGITPASRNQSVRRLSGIFGDIDGYIGTVEAQGRGTLHLHMVLWLRGSPTVSKMKELLLSNHFRDKMKQFIAANIQVDIPDSPGHTVLSIPHQLSVAFSRPVDPRKPHYDARRREAEKRIARTVQVHQCNHACMKPSRTGMVCKRKAPFPLANDDWVGENGKCGLKRTYGYLNNWCPAILQCIRANHDIKLITNGSETKDIAWYITHYVAKKQKESFNISALLAKSFAFHNKSRPVGVNLAAMNKRLIQKCANSLSREQELSAPQVISYLMGWGDRFLSHHFETIHWYSVANLLRKTYPSLNEREANVPELHSDAGLQSTSQPQQDEQCNDTVNIQIVQGQLKVKDQVRDYMDRGELLQNWSYLDFFLGTYDAPILKEKTTLRGRPSNPRVPYIAGSNHTGRCRVVKCSGHETMPYFPGRWFPNRNNTSELSYFEASMLTLLKPWRNLIDIKQPEQSFHDAYSSFVDTCSNEICDTIENFSFFHDCSDTARLRSRESNALLNDDHDAINLNDDVEDPELPVHPEQDKVGNFENLINEDDIQQALDHPFSSREILYADSAIDVGIRSGVLTFNQSAIPIQIRAHPATSRDQEQFHVWENALSTLPAMDEPIPPSDALAVPQDQADVHVQSLHEPDATMTMNNPESCLPFCPTLNRKQTMAHDIITAHLHAHLVNQNTTQRLMIVHGQGGTGKTALLNAISNSFVKMASPHSLTKTAMSGVAASLIGSQTLHSWAALPIRQSKLDNWLTHPGKEIDRRRKRNVGGVVWLTIDEMSMMTTPQLAHLSQITSVVRSGETAIDVTSPFGQLSVVLLGDLHQLPPVASTMKTLYNSYPPDHFCYLGRTIYEQFDIVVKLNEQMRIQDKVWQDILDRARTGDCTTQDISELKKLVLSNPECDVPNFENSPWNEAILVTSRNGVRTLWNNEALSRHCHKTGNVHYVLYALDTCNDHPLSMQERLSIAHLKLDVTNNLPNRVDLAIGMKAMIILNISTDVDLANGSRGLISDIILDSREILPDDTSTTIYLTYPPAVILFRPFTDKTIKLPGLDRGTIPVFPTHKTFSLDGEKKTKIDRWQFPITPAYAFTDFKSQGQTMECVIADIGKPPSGALSPFDVYVTLSRSRGRPSIRLLRDFEERLFTTHPSEELQKEDARLGLLEEKTLERYNAGEFGEPSRSFI